MTSKQLLASTMTEEQLGENVRDACNKLGWRFLWLRKTYNSSAGILDLLLIPERWHPSRHVLFRELKGYDKRGKLGKVTDAQQRTIQALSTQDQDADVWTPEDWHSGRILKELE